MNRLKIPVSLFSSKLLDSLFMGFSLGLDLFYYFQQSLVIIFALVIILVFVVFSFSNWIDWTLSSLFIIFSSTLNWY